MVCARCPVAGGRCPVSSPLFIYVFFYILIFLRPLHKKASGGLAPNDTLRPQTACTERKQNYSKGGHCRTSTVELASTRHTRTMNTREICSCRCLGASSYLAGIFLHCGASCRPGYVTMTIVQTTHDDRASNAARQHAGMTALPSCFRRVTSSMECELCNEFSSAIFAPWFHFSFALSCFLPRQSCWKRVVAARLTLL